MLSKRLLACAAYVREKSFFCDVGTDHGYLPCYLLQKGITSHVLGADLNPLPLACAHKTARSLALADQVELILSDGLQNVPPEKADDIVIAGMGGELIAKIIGAVNWVRDPEKRLILQPMTQQPFLRRWLCQQGFVIQSETPVQENGHFYSVLCCIYSGVPREISEFEAWTGALCDASCRDNRAYMQHQYGRLQKIILGLTKAGSDPQQTECYRKLAEQIKQFWNLSDSILKKNEYNKEESFFRAFE